MRDWSAVVWSWASDPRSDAVSSGFWQVLCAVSVCLAASSCLQPDSETLELELARPIKSCDPQITHDVTTRSVLGNIYEPLAKLEPDRGLVPVLATSWTTPDDTTWRFELRSEVRFHDGHLLTSADVAYTIERGRSDPKSAVRDYLSAVDSIETVDESTLIVRTSRPAPLLLNRLLEVPIVASGFGSSGALANGTGPYRVRSLNQDGDLILDSFEQYWQGPPNWKEVRIRFEPELDARLGRLLRGEVDVIGDLDSAAMQQIESDSATRLVEHPASRVGILGFLTVPPEDNPFADPQVRRALSLAIDRQQLVEVVYGGHARVATQLAPPGIFGFLSDLPVQRADLAAARQALADSRFPEGFEAPLAFHVDNAELATAIAAQLAQIGVVLELQQTSWPDLDAAMQAQQQPAYLFSMTYPTGETSTVLQEGFYSSKERGRGVLNFSGFSDPEYDRMIEQIEVELDNTSRLRLLDAAMRRVMDARVWLPLVVRAQVFGARSSLSWEPTITGSLVLQDIR